MDDRMADSEMLADIERNAFNQGYEAGIMECKQKVLKAINTAKFRLKGNREVLSEYDILDMLGEELGLK